MASYQTAMRQACYNKIDSESGDLPITDFTLTDTYFPHYYADRIRDKPVVAVTAMGMGAERLRRLRDATIKQIRLSVLVTILQQIEDRDDTTTIDTLIEQGEAIMAKLENDGLAVDTHWEETEPLKDENGMIYDYEALSESGIFQSVFIVHYTYILQ